MSIELENPKTLVEKIDAASNFVAQIRIALSVHDLMHANAAIERAASLLAEALDMVEDNSLQWGAPNTRTAGMVRDVGPWRSPTQEERETQTE